MTNARKFFANRPNGLRIPGGWLIMALLAFRVLFLLLGDGLINGDGTIYVKAAQEIVATGRLPPARFQSLGFAVVLAPVIALLGPKAIGFNYDTTQLYPGDAVANTVHVIHVFMDLATVLVLLHESGKLLARVANRSRGIWALAFIALQPFTAAMTTYVYPDHACMFFFFMGGWLVYHSLWREVALLRLALGSLFLGVAGLIRVDMLPVCSALLIAAYVLLFSNTARSWWSRAIVVSMTMLLLPPVGMTIFQYRSTGEIGYVRLDDANNAGLVRGGYFGWLRTWIILVQSEVLVFHTMDDQPDWQGFNIDAYPGRAFKSGEERTEIASLLAAWQKSGYTTEIDDKFKQVAASTRRERPIRTFLLVPAARMLHYWINLEGARAIHVSLRIEPPWSRVATAVVFPFRVLFVFMAAIGLYVAWARQRTHILGDGDGLGIARFCSLMVVLRTGELGVLGIFVVGGLMETRYMLVALPAMLLLAVVGWCEIASWRRTKPTQPEVSRMRHVKQPVS